jgi:Kdo2-lipid IVA lauroyltransferase/acyltransferase
MRSLFLLFARLPLWVAHLVGWWLGWVAYLGSSVYRQRFQANVRLAGLGHDVARRAVGASGQQVAEVAKLWYGDVPWQIDDHACVAQALAHGKGLIFLTPHLGCFEVTAQAYAAIYGKPQGKPMTVLFRPPRKAWLVDVVTHARARPGLLAAPTSAAGVKQLLRALKNGEAIGVLPDQVPPLGQGSWAPFFGQDAYTMTLAMRLAQQTGAAVLAAWGERLPRGRGYLVHVEPIEAVLGAPLQVDLQGAVAQMNEAMEKLILRCPSQYLWGYARYKSPKAEG